MIINYLGILTILSYLSLALAQTLHLFGYFHCSRWRYFIISVFSISGHGWILYKLIETPQGQNLNWLIMLSFTLWLMNILTLLASIRQPIENLCVLTYPVAALSVGLALSFAGVNVVDTSAQPGVLAHIFISLFATSILALASLQALLMGLQNTLLKRHRPSPMLQILPPLQTMEHFLFLIIGWGMIFLSGSLVTGFFFQEHAVTAYLFSKALLALGAWVLLAFLLVGRFWFGWRGPTAIRWTLSTTLLTFLSYFGTKAL
jgi:ABC-type uncharacterized transport system permease subunit